jgi:hypothetical protein
MVTVSDYPRLAVGDSLFSKTGASGKTFEAVDPEASDLDF